MMRTGFLLTACGAVCLSAAPGPLLAQAPDEGRRGRGGRPACRIQGEPARRRDREAAPRLAAPVGGARRRPVRLPGARRAQRAGPARRARPGVGLGACRVGRVHAARVRRTGAPVGAALFLAGARLGRRAASRRRGARPRPGRWGCWPRPIGRPAGSSPIGPRTPRTRARARCCAREFKVSGPVERGARLRHQPRPVRAAAQRPARGRQTSSRPDGPATTSACSTRPTTSPPLLKPGANAVGAMLGDGWYRGELGWQDRRNLYGSRLAPARADRDHLRGRPRAGRGHRRALEAVDGADPDVGDLQRRDLRRAPREGGLGHAPASTTAPGRA